MAESHRIKWWICCSKSSGLKGKNEVPFYSSHCENILKWTFSHTMVVVSVNIYKQLQIITNFLGDNFLEFIKSSNATWQSHLNPFYRNTRIWASWLRRWRLCLQCRKLGFNPWVGKIPLEKEMAVPSSRLAWKSHSQRSLEDYSPQGCRESDTTEQLTVSLHFRGCSL